MSSLKSHCSLSYHNMALDQVESFALGVKAGYYGHNPPFTVLPIIEAALQILIANYTNKRADYINGGAAQKGPFLIAKADLMSALDSLANQTDIVADGDEPTIILAGFVPTKGGHSPATKPVQCVVTVKKGITGELISTCAPVPSAKHYGCIMLEGGQLPDGVVINADGRVVWQSKDPQPNMNQQDTKITGVWVDLTDQREKHFTGLKHDAVYYFYYYAVNAAGVSQLSEVVSMVCW